MNHELTIYFHEISELLDDPAIVTELIICLVGLILLACWFIKTSMGTKALADSLPRRNNMPLYLPFIPLLIWWAAISIAMLVTNKFLPDLQDWQMAFAGNLILCGCSIVTLPVIIFFARVHFARRLKGFGLNPKTILKDFFAAIVNLLSVWPILTLTLVLTIFLSKLIWGQDFEMPRHEELKLIAEYSQLPLRILIVITAVLIAPLLEEMLFRGLFQTMIRSFLLNFRYRQSAWLSIIISAALFAVVHQAPGHWPTIFILGVCLGYAYEKSGSLFRPIFIHCLFNATAVIAALYQ